MPTGVKATWETVSNFQIGKVALTDFVGAYNGARTSIDEYSKKKTELMRLKITRDVPVPPKRWYISARRFVGGGFRHSLSPKRTRL